MLELFHKLVPLGMGQIAAGIDGVEDTLTDRLLLGPDILLTNDRISISATAARRHSSSAASEKRDTARESRRHEGRRPRYLELRDVDIVQGGFEASVARALRARAGKLGMLEHDLAALASDAPVETTQLNNRALLRGLRRSPLVQDSAKNKHGNFQDYQNSQLLRTFSLKSRRAAWMVMGNVDAFAALSVHARMRSPGLDIPPRGIRRLLIAMRSTKPHEAVADDYVPTVEDLRLLSAALDVPLLLVVLAADPGGQRYDSGSPKHGGAQVLELSFPTGAEQTGEKTPRRVPVFFLRPGRGVDALLNLNPRHILTFSMQKEIPEVLRVLRASTTKKSTATARGALSSYL
jgi:hypothetical protein